MEPTNSLNKKSFISILGRDFKLNGSIYLLSIPVLLFYIVFCYIPMYGVIMAFKEFEPAKGILGSQWIGWANFNDFFGSIFFGRVLVNTLKISLSSIVFGFPAPILLALLINELEKKRFQKLVQTVTYMPYFISLVVICGMIQIFTAEKGFINQIITLFGGTRSTLLNNPANFISIYIISDIWQQAGWGSIIYLAALAGVDQSLYEAAKIDGAGRLRQTWHVTLPGIMPTIITLLVLRMGSVLNVGFEKIILLYNPSTYETADVISSFVYRVGLQDFRYGYSAAVGLFNAVINFAMVVLANAVSRKINGTSLW